MVGDGDRFTGGTDLACNGAQAGAGFHDRVGRLRRAHHLTEVCTSKTWLFGPAGLALPAAPVQHRTPPDGYRRALEAHRAAAPPSRAGLAIAEAVERQNQAMRELSRRAFPEADVVPDEALATIEQTRAQRVLPLQERSPDTVMPGQAPGCRSSPRRGPLLRSGPG
ncbi:hypothetical protein GCM10010406_41200 [Streptomyces thermolineatus]|uniref:Uncharacterized protein n=1 Tax=Streptomyces thermolineatus TaxID=44033 RepID=A0ABP5ZKS1_9ACTN